MRRDFVKVRNKRMYTAKVHGIEPGVYIRKEILMQVGCSLRCYRCKK